MNVLKMSAIKINFVCNFYDQMYDKFDPVVYLKCRRGLPSAFSHTALPKAL